MRRWQLARLLAGDRANAAVVELIARRERDLARWFKGNVASADDLIAYFGLGQSIRLETTQGVPELPATTLRNRLYRALDALREWLGDDLTNALKQTGPWDDPFWARVDKGNNADCWLWLGAMSMGYGVCKRDGVKRQAQRVAFELANGRVPTPDEHIVHRYRSCDRRCCNPSHLASVAPGERLPEWDDERKQ
jgi:hypothetical protein